ncbi:MAG: hypothetical protein PHN55_13495, partial [Dysgonamonadaceae bacterium]|nr:hypothetical protein [Dysgonamonadaceae bacterium]
YYTILILVYPRHQNLGHLREKIPNQAVPLINDIGNIIPTFLKNNSLECVGDGESWDLFLPVSATRRLCSFNI